MSIKYQLASNTWDGLEEAAIARVIKSNQYTMGVEVSAFEDQFSKFVGMKHAVMVNSGSSANLIACSAFKFSNRFKTGTVIVPSVSWSTTYFPLSQMGFKLKFVDIDLSTLNIDVKKIEGMIDDDVVGICGVSLLGNPTGMDSLRTICDKFNLFFYEDNCESLGAKIDGKLAGSFGDISSHSFFFSHHLQTMEGGMVCTDDDQYAMLARSLRAHGWTRDKKSGDLSDGLCDPFHKSFEFILPGYCVRPIEFMGAIGQVQLAKWPEMLKYRLANADLFKNIMSKYVNYILIQDCQLNVSSWFGFAMVLTGNAAGKRGLLAKILDRYGIEYRPIVAGNFTRQKVLQYIDHSELSNYPAADQVHFNGIFVGNDAKDLSNEIDLLDAALSEFINEINS
jgi:CDP-6-deoxy-D-xylo-4-hexulose-3-dehydrase